jgi:hypothetical protein
MAEALDGVWNNLDCIVQQGVRRMNGTEHRGLSPDRRPNDGGNPNESDRSTRLICQSPAADLPAAFSGAPRREPMSSDTSARCRCF